MRAIRLTGGLDRCAGKVEIHRNGSWGSLCDNAWNIHLATMVCSMLQCGGGAKPEKFSRIASFTHNNATPKYFYVCPQTATSLWQCQEIYTNPFLCMGSQPSGVICNGECLWRGFNEHDQKVKCMKRIRKKTLLLHKCLVLLSDILEINIEIYTWYSKKPEEM